LAAIAADRQGPATIRLSAAASLRWRDRNSSKSPRSGYNTLISSRKLPVGGAGIAANRQGPATKRLSAAANRPLAGQE